MTIGDRVKYRDTIGVIARMDEPAGYAKVMQGPFCTFVSAPIAELEEVDDSRQLSLPIGWTLA